VTAALIAGAVCGLGLFLFAFALIPRRISLARQVAAFDAGRPAAVRAGSRPGLDAESDFSRWLGTALAKFCAEQGWEFRSLRSSLALVDKSFENYLASKVLMAILGLLFAPILLFALTFSGLHLTFIVPVWTGLVLAAVFFLLPDLELRQKVEQRRRDFRHAIGAFLDLVAMNLSGGRGVPEALLAASEIGTGWAMWRIREALVNARITGHTPWQALGALGEEIRVDELRDLAADPCGQPAAARASRHAGRGGGAVAVHAGRPDAALRSVPDLPYLPGGAGDARVLVTNACRRNNKAGRTRRETMRAQVPGQMELDYARTLLGVRLAEFRAARQQRDRGASAIELAIITAIIVGLAAIVLIVITHIVQTRANQINQNNGQIP
jgi:hypothetical protein